MKFLFGEELLPRPRREIAPGATWVPNWLNGEQQRWLVRSFYQWAHGPVPPRHALIHGKPMSVQSVCLGWHWSPYQYTRRAIDVNGRPVLPVPDWMIRMGQQAILEVTGEPEAARDHLVDAALVNWYDADSKMGMHQDREERSHKPVISISLGDTCGFRMGNPHTRGQPYEDINLASGDLLVFGGPSRLAFHGVTRIYPGTAPDECGLTSGRINITLRVTGLDDSPTESATPGIP